MYLQTISKPSNPENKAWESSSMSSILAAILIKKQHYIHTLYEEYGIDYFSELANKRVSLLSLAKAISTPGLSLIAECKKQSPSKGIIRDPYDPVSLACSFEIVTPRDIHFLNASKVLLERYFCIVSGLNVLHP